jgi:maleylacetate reductase
VIVRWGLEQLPEMLAEVGSDQPFVIASDRWTQLDLPGTGRWSEVPSERIPEIAGQAQGADGILAVGGGSAIDLAKAVSAATNLPLVSVPTTYSGAEWTPFYGVRDPQKHMVGGGGGAHLAGIVYDPKLTLDLPRAESGGTAMNALAHSAEALYVTGRNPTGDEHALEGARLIGEALPDVLADGQDLEKRTTLLEGAMHAGMALGAAGLGLGHAMAQAVGGRYGIPHGAANALCLPPALRFNDPVAGAEIARFGEALGADDPIARTEELAGLAGYERLRDLGVPENELEEVAEATAVRGGALANPRPASPAEIAELFREIW